MFRQGLMLLYNVAIASRLNPLDREIDLLVWVVQDTLPGELLSIGNIWVEEPEVLHDDDMPVVFVVLIGDLLHAFKLLLIHGD